MAPVPTAQYRIFYFVCRVTSYDYLAIYINTTRRSFVNFRCLIIYSGVERECLEGQAGAVVAGHTLHSLKYIPDLAE